MTVLSVKAIARRALGRMPPPSPPSCVSLYYWRPRGGLQNFGDHLSSAISTKMAAERGRFFDEIVPHPRRMLAIGSVLHIAVDGNVIWGSGFNGSVALERHKYANLDVRAVRGPLTRAFLEARGIAVPPIFGDPALLTRRLLGMRFPRPERRCPVVFVPNFQDLEIMSDWENVVSPHLPWAQVISRIVAAQHIVSSSLHGLVLADSFGIPCTYLRLSEREGVFKYEDYCLGAGRDALRITTSREEAIRATPLDPPQPDLDSLYDAFPWDLWD